MVGAPLTDEEAAELAEHLSPDATKEELSAAVKRAKSRCGRSAICGLLTCLAGTGVAT